MTFGATTTRLASTLRQERLFFRVGPKVSRHVPVYLKSIVNRSPASWTRAFSAPGGRPENIDALWSRKPLKAAHWEYYPFLDVIHRERLLNSGAGPRAIALSDYNETNMGLAISFAARRSFGLSRHHKANIGDEYNFTICPAVSRMLGYQHGARGFRLFISSRWRRHSSSDCDVLERSAHLSKSRSTDWSAEDSRCPATATSSRPDDFRQYRARVRVRSLKLCAA